MNKIVPGYRNSHLLRIVLMLIAMKIRNVTKKKVQHFRGPLDRR